MSGSHAIRDRRARPDRRPNVMSTRALQRALVLGLGTLSTVCVSSEGQRLGQNQGLGRRLGLGAGREDSSSTGSSGGSSSSSTSLLGSGGSSSSSSSSASTILVTADANLASARRKLEANARRLLDIAADSSTWTFPRYATLAIGAVTASYTQITVAAMKQYEGIQIEATGYSFGTDHDNAAVKLVTSGTVRTECSGSTRDVAMSTVVDSSNNVESSAMSLGSGLSMSNAGSYFLTAPNALFKFMHGGYFKLCYTPDGTFDDDDTNLANAVFHTVIKVAGVASSCNTENCLRDEVWHCHFNYLTTEASPCEINVTENSGRSGWSITEVSGGSSRLSWTELWTADSVDSNGLFVSEAYESCAASDPDNQKIGAVTATTYGVDMSGGKAVLPSITTRATGAFTVTACYCPNHQAVSNSACAQRADYIQSIGRLYFWTAYICDESALDSSCAARYGQVIPQQPFRVRISCPAGKSCTSGSNTNQLRLRDSTTDYDRPNWDTLQPCQVQGTASSTSLLTWPNGDSVRGGSRADYKDFEGTSPFRLHLPTNDGVEVCYCDSDCSENANWLHVGKVSTIQAFAVASSTASTSGTATMKYIHKASSLTLYGGIISTNNVLNPYDSPRYSDDQSNSLVKFYSYDRDSLTTGGSTIEADVAGGTIKAQAASLDSICQSNGFQGGQIDSFSSASTASNFAATASSDRTRLPFNGPSHDQTFTPTQAGTLVVCYCGTVTTTNGVRECDEPATNWIFATLLAIRGPKGGQEWRIGRGIRFGFTLEGWGFESTDTVRILASGQDCTADSFDPTSTYTGLYTGCPSADGTGCLQADSKHNLPLSILSTTSSDTPLYITKATVSSSSTKLTFSSSITNSLATGDVIKISLDSFAVDGRLRASWTSDDKYNAELLAGVRSYADDSSLDARFLGHKVTVVSGSTTQVTIPIGWDVDPVFTFTSLAGVWSKHNKASSEYSLEAITPSSSLPVCWAPNEDGTKYYAEAGTISIVEPPSMAFAKVAITATRENSVAPVILAFGTNRTASRYLEEVASRTSLRIAFLDVGTADGPTGGKLAPLIGKPLDRSGNEPWLDPTEEVASTSASQSACGYLFSELWSNDDQGFPLPSGCYYGRRYKYIQGTGYYRELYLRFAPNNGLKSICTSQGAKVDCEYQIVINAEVGTIDQDEHLLDIDTNCIDCDAPSEVIERGTAVCTKATATAESSDPQMDVSITDANSVGIATLTEQDEDDTIPQLTLFMEGLPSPAARVTADAILRLYLWPLTAWELQGSQLAAAETDSTCKVTCAPATSPAGLLCGPEVPCQVSSVASTQSPHRNQLTLTLPSNMDAISVGMGHTLKISSLAVPATGWFPNRMGFELTDENDTKPYYYLTQASIFKAPSEGATTGRLVVDGRTGYGESPFTSEANTLLLRLQLGVTLRDSQEDNTAVMTVHLPDGYSCEGAVATVGNPDFTHEIFSLDEDEDGYLDHSQSVIDGTWSNEDAVCTWRPTDWSAIYAGSVFYTLIVVNNPSSMFTKYDDGNVWSIEAEGKGSSSTLTSSGEGKFMTLSEEASWGNETWASNFASLGIWPAGSQVMQPGSFAAGATHMMKFFIYTDAGMSANGYLIVDAPEGFDFSSSCTVEDLDSKYYEVGVQSSTTTYQVGEIKSCTTSSTYSTSPSLYNRLEMQIVKGLFSTTSYAFALSVTNPTSAPGSDPWLLWTRAESGTGLEGTQEAPRFDALETGSFLVYQKSLTGLATVFPGGMVRPTSLSGSAALVTLTGLSVPTTGSYTLRVTAPLGFTFSKDSGAANNFTWLAVGDNGATATLTTIPSGGNDQQLLWSTAVQFTTGFVYGFSTDMEIPDIASTVSAQSFFVEFNYNAAAFANRLQAGYADLPVFQSITDCTVETRTTVVSYRHNHLVLTFRTATAVPSGGIITIDSSLAMTLECPTELTGFPSDASCAVDNTKVQMVITAGSTAIPAGFYTLSFDAQNPKTTSAAGTWTFGTYYGLDSNNDPTGPIDHSAVITGFPIYSAMKQALLLVRSESINRNDRPRNRNYLTFIFVPLLTSSSPTLVVRAPEGFVFDEYCEDALNVSEVWLVNTERSSVAWPATTASCRGGGSMATLKLKGSFIAGQSYAFVLSPRQNALVTPEWNYWCIELDQESTEPFVGFDIFTFSNAAAHPVVASSVSSGTPSVPVQVSFEPYNTIPGDTGMLRFTAPSQYSFVSCLGELSTEATDPDTIWDPTDLTCNLVNTSSMELTLSGERDVEAGVTYYLTAWVQVPLLGANADASSSMYWRLESFSEGPATDDTALDDVFVQSFELGSSFSEMTVTNVESGMKGSEEVTVTVSFVAGRTLAVGDKLALLGPEDFSFLDSTTSTCGTIQGDAFTAASSSLSCPCTTSMSSMVTEDATTLANCVMSWAISSAQSASTTISFTVSTTNPATRLRLAKNFWALQHWRGSTLLASKAVESWSIEPQLHSLTLAISGSLQAAGATTRLTVSFMPVYSAGALQLEVLSPSGFDFCGASATSPAAVVEREDCSSSPSKILLTTTITSGVQVSVKISDVVLSPTGGTTIVSVQTFDSSSAGYTREELEDLMVVFPGNLATTSQTLECLHAEDSTLYPVTYSFPARVDEQSWLETYFTLTQPAAAGDDLILVSDSEENLFDIDSSTFELKKVISSSSTQTISVVVSKTSSSNRLSVALGAALEAGQTYYLKCGVTPSGTGSASWTIQIDSGGVYPSNTNDAEDYGFVVVPQTDISVTVSRAPPTATVQVSLVLNTKATGFQQLIVPAGVLLPLGEGACAVGTNFVCTDVGTFRGRRVANLSGIDGADLPTGKSLLIKVTMPEVAEDNPVWALLSADTVDETPTQWGYMDSFPLHPLASLGFHYVATASATDVKVSAVFSVDVNAGGSRIVVQAPVGYTLSCTSANSVHQIALPGNTPGCVDSSSVTGALSSSRQLRVDLNGTVLGSDDYAFAFLAAIPASATTGTSADETWSMVIYDASGNVVHSAFRAPAQRIISTSVSISSFTWSAANADQVALITFGLYFNSTTDSLAAISFLLPEYVVHDNREASDVEILTGTFPSTGVSLDEASVVTILVNANATIATGLYRFRFRVLLSSLLPEQNLWYVSLCDGTPCTTSTGDQVLMSLAVEGFDLGDASNVDPGTVSAAAKQMPGAHLLSFATLLIGYSSLFSLPHNWRAEAQE